MIFIGVLVAWEGTCLVVVIELLVSVLNVVVSFRGEVSVVREK